MKTGRMDLEISQDITTVQDGAVLHCTGDIDSQTCEQFAEALEELFAAGRYKIILDLAAVEYVSSAGAGAIISAAATAQQHSGRLVLMNPKPNVCSVFSLMGLPDFLKVAADLPAALASL